MAVKLPKRVKDLPTRFSRTEHRDALRDPFDVGIKPLPGLCKFAPRTLEPPAREQHAMAALAKSAQTPFLPDKLIMWFAAQCVYGMLHSKHARYAILLVSTGIVVEDKKSAHIEMRMPSEDIERNAGLYPAWRNAGKSMVAVDEQKAQAAIKSQAHIHAISGKRTHPRKIKTSLHAIMNRLIREQVYGIKRTAMLSNMLTKNRRTSVAFQHSDFSKSPAYRKGVKQRFEVVHSPPFKRWPHAEYPKH